MIQLWNKEFLKELVLYVEENQNVGVVGPKIYYYDHPDKIQVTTAKIDFWTGRNSLVGDGELENGQYDNISVTDYVSGACFLVKREIINKFGFLDPNFACYWEETDYCMSIRRGRLSMYFITQIHLFGIKDQNQQTNLPVF